MNNTPFPITSLQKGKFIVSWPSWDNIRRFETKKLLVDLLFKDMKVKEAGFVLDISDGEIDIMWVDEYWWMRDSNGEYARYLEDMYTVKGVAFNNKDEAIKLQDYLEKKYIWKTLQA
jgi:hypothetical protein